MQLHSAHAKQRGPGPCRQIEKRERQGVVVSFLLARAFFRGRRRAGGRFCRRAAIVIMRERATPPHTPTEKREEAGAVGYPASLRTKAKSTRQTDVDIEENERERLAH